MEQTPLKTVDGIIAIEKHKIWRDIMFTIDGSPTNMTISDTCSVDRWIFKPMIKDQKSTQAFFTQISKLFCELAIRRNVPGNKFADGTGLFDNAVFDFQRDRGTITFKGRRDVINESWYSYKKPLDTYITLNDVLVGDPCAREIALLLHSIQSVDTPRVKGFFRKHLYIPGEPINSKNQIAFRKHYEEPLS